MNYRLLLNQEQLLAGFGLTAKFAIIDYNVALTTKLEVEYGLRRILRKVQEEAANQERR